MVVVTCSTCSFNPTVSPRLPAAATMLLLLVQLPPPPPPLPPWYDPPVGHPLVHPVGRQQGGLEMLVLRPAIDIHNLDDMKSGPSGITDREVLPPFLPPSLSLNPHGARAHLPPIIASQTPPSISIPLCPQHPCYDGTTYAESTRLWKRSSLRQARQADRRTHQIPSSAREVSPRPPPSLGAAPHISRATTLTASHSDLGC